MKLSRISIQNFGSLKNMSFEIGMIHSIVGANNSGKSTLLKALDFLFNPSTKSLSKDSFWNMNTNQEIRVEAIFSELTSTEKEKLSSNIMPDETFHVARVAKFQSDSTDLGNISDDTKIVISQQYLTTSPKVEWLNTSMINGEKIKTWWANRNELSVEGVKFLKDCSKPPNVSEWKKLANDFVTEHQDIIETEYAWIDNPQGYANVLKGILPFYILVPAVRDVTDEAKAIKSNPFGKLLNSILNSITENETNELNEILTKIAKKMNRIGGSERVALIQDTEQQINDILKDYFADCDLEIEFSAPTFETLLSTPKLFIDDGLRNTVENKGHGLQRAVIFSILRRYADFITTQETDRQRNMIIAIEEPELYMHPQAQRAIRKVLGSIASSGDQVFYSTHSALLVDVDNSQEIIRMEKITEIIDSKKQIQSKGWQIQLSKFVIDLEIRQPSLKGKVTEESIKSKNFNAYNPSRNEGFFASKIILVEGPTEEYSFPIYAEAMGYPLDSLGISIIECGCKGEIDRFYRFFNELHIPCYIIFDYDYGNSELKRIRESKDLINIIGDNDNGGITDYVSSKVAFFRCNYEDVYSTIEDLDKIKSEAEENGIIYSKNKPLFARFLAYKLTSQTPPMIPELIRQMIDHAVKVEWTGSCLKGESS